MKKQYRVKKTEEIEGILKAKQFAANPYFSLYKKENKETSNFRYAISVGKKLGNAVIRHKLKRQVTSIINNLNLNLESNIDVFIIVREKALELDFDNLEKQLEYLFKRQKLI